MWEYKTKRVSWGEQLDKYLAKMGDESWELTGVFLRYPCEGNSVCLIFKRRLA